MKRIACILLLLTTLALADDKNKEEESSKAIPKPIVEQLQKATIDRDRAAITLQNARQLFGENPGSSFRDALALIDSDWQAKEGRLATLILSARIDLEIPKGWALNTQGWIFYKPVTKPAQ